MKKLKMALVTTLLIVTLGGCVPVSDAQKTMAMQDVKKQKQAAKMMETVKAPEFDYSIERENIAMRLVVSNNPLTIGWIYPMSAGRVLGRFPVRGKVTSGSKRLTNTEMYTYIAVNDGNYSYERMPSPDEMGTYGSSGEYVFWFSPSGNLSQHKGDYFYSVEPYQIDLGYGTIKYDSIDNQELLKVKQYEQQAKKSYEELKKQIANLKK